MKLQKGTVTFWTCVPEGVDAAEVLDRLTFSLAQAAMISGVALFPEGAKDLTDVTKDDFVAMAKTEVLSYGRTPEDVDKWTAEVEAEVAKAKAEATV